MDENYEIVQRSSDEGFLQKGISNFLKLIVAMSRI